MEARVADTTKNCTGYCSWYYYYHQVTERQFIESIEAMSAKKAVFPVQYAQIDDGYQTYHGDWLEQNENWPTPLADTVKKINDMGMQAGIWTMPFLASKASKVFQNRPDWFVHDRHNQPWYIQGWSPEPNHEWACLDISRSDVQKHLYSVYETLYGMGFRYFKFDGGGFSAPAGTRCAPDATGVSCLRDGLKLIRKAVKDSLVLGCGMPFLASTGLVDNNRVSSDTGKTWQAWGLPTVEGQDIDRSQPCDPVGPSLKIALHGTLCRWWQYDRWFRADPDVVMARDENTELTIAEARLSALTAIITGVAFTSDRLDRMGKDRLRLLSLAAKLRIRDIKPLDWEDKAYSYLFEGLIDNYRAVAIVNYSEYPQKVKFSELNMPAVCKELLHPCAKVKDSLEISPHDAALLVEEKYESEFAKKV
jgi:alpha-galactosidase